MSAAGSNQLYCGERQNTLAPKEFSVMEMIKIVNACKYPRDS